MLETAILDSALQFWLQEEILETGGVDADVSLLALLGSCLLSFLGDVVVILIVIEKSLIIVISFGSLSRKNELWKSWCE
jgi:hypothetical protein